MSKFGEDERMLTLGNHEAICTAFQGKQSTSVGRGVGTRVGTLVGTDVGT